MTEIRVRREPPQFRELEVSSVERPNARFVRLRLAGAALAGFDIGLPAASVRLLLPTDGFALEVPVWNGNEFLLADGSRPTIRTLTPLRFDSTQLELELEVVLHGHGPLSRWAAEVQPGAPVALSGTGRGYEIMESAEDFLLAGDESALPAISVLLRALPGQATVRVFVESLTDDVLAGLPEHPRATLHWVESKPNSQPLDALVSAVAGISLEPNIQIWAAGEAAAMQRIRRDLFETRGLPRSNVVVRGYWKSNH